MGINIKFLGSTDLNQIVHAFNKAFEGYFVTLNFDIDSFQSKLTQESIDLELSVGAFDNEELVGFMFIGVKPEEQSFYNAGTGVISSNRGQQLTKKMYQLLLPRMSSLGYKTGILEVVKGNDPAIHIYSLLGYEITRTLECYKLNQDYPKLKEQNWVVEEIVNWQLNDWNSFDQWSPTWQNDNTSITNIMDRLTAIQVSDNGEGLGYAIFDKAKGRIHQLSVKKESRNKGIASALLNYISSNSLSNLHWGNVDGNHMATNQWMVNRGFEVFLTQYEMILDLE